MSEFIWAPASARALAFWCWLAVLTGVVAAAAWTLGTNLQSLIA